MVYSVANISQGTFKFWPLAAGVIGLGAVSDRLLAFRPSFVRVEGTRLFIRSHVGFTDRRELEQLLTVEWHGQGWRESLVFNFVDYIDNVRISATGFSREAVEGFAEGIGKEFLTVP